MWKFCRLINLLKWKSVLGTTLGQGIQIWFANQKLLLFPSACCTDASISAYNQGYIIDKILTFNIINVYYCMLILYIFNIYIVHHHYTGFKLVSSGLMAHYTIKRANQIYALSTRMAFGLKIHILYLPQFLFLRNCKLCLQLGSIGNKNNRVSENENIYTYIGKEVYIPLYSVF